MNHRQPALNLVVAVALGAGLALALLTLLAPPIRPVTAAAMAREAASDLEISKTDGVETVQPGDTLTYTIAITNNGVQTATGVVLTDTLPLSTTFVGPAAHWQQVGLTKAYTHAVGALEPGAGAYTTTLVVTVDTPLSAELEQITNTVEVTDESDAYAHDTDVNTVAAAPLPDGVITVCQEGGCDYTIIQDAVDAAEEGDEIRVAAGTYTELNNRGGLAQIVYLDKNVTLRGGYTTTNWTESDPNAHPTTLDAGHGGRGLYVAGAPTVEQLRIVSGNAVGLGGGPSFASHAGGGVYVHRGQASLHGLLILRSSADVGGGLYLHQTRARLAGSTILSNTARYGGGVGISGSPALVEGNVVEHNTASKFGGGFYVRYSDVELRGNRIAANAAADGGGGLCLNRDGGRLVGNDIASNMTLRYGGGAYLFESAAVLVDNRIVANQARGQYGGGGLCLSGGSPRLAENVLADNQADDRGGGLSLFGGDAVLTNTILAENWAGEGGGAAYASGGLLRFLHTTLVGRAPVPQAQDAASSGLRVQSGRVALTNTVLVRHGTGVYAAQDASVTLESTLWGEGEWANGQDWAGEGAVQHQNDYAEPPGFLDPAAGDFHIRTDSPAVDRGVDAGVTADIDGHPRPIGSGFDLGADESTGIDLSGSSKSVHPHTATAGDTLTYTILLRNSGHLTSEHVRLVDATPPSTTFIAGSAQASQGLVFGDQSGVLWTGSVAPLQPVTITFRVTVTGEGTIENVAEVTDAYGERTLLNVWVNGCRHYLPLVTRSH